MRADMWTATTQASVCIRQGEAYRQAVTCASRSRILNLAMTEQSPDHDDLRLPTSATGLKVVRRRQVSHVMP